MKIKIQKKDLLYPEESYQIIGILFDVYNNLGPGHHEKYYQPAISEALKQNKIQFQRQVFYPLKYKNISIGRQYFDFLLFEKIILEIKKGNSFSKRHIDQVPEYLKVSGHKLAILANFSQEGVTFRRIINFNS